MNLAKFFKIPDKVIDTMNQEMTELGLDPVVFYVMLQGKELEISNQEYKVIPRIKWNFPPTIEFDLFLWSDLEPEKFFKIGTYEWED